MHQSYNVNETWDISKMPGYEGLSEEERAKKGPFGVNEDSTLEPSSSPTTSPTVSPTEFPTLAPTEILASTVAASAAGDGATASSSLLIVGIVVAAIVVVLGVYLYTRRQKQKAQREEVTRVVRAWRAKFSQSDKSSKKPFPDTAEVWPRPTAMVAMRTNPDPFQAPSDGGDPFAGGPFAASAGASADPFGLPDRGDGFPGGLPPLQKSGGPPSRSSGPPRLPPLSTRDPFGKPSSVSRPPPSLRPSGARMPLPPPSMSRSQRMPPPSLRPPGARMPPPSLRPSGARMPPPSLRPSGARMPLPPPSLRRSGGPRPMYRPRWQAAAAPAMAMARFGGYGGQPMRPPPPGRGPSFSGPRPGMRSMGPGGPGFRPGFRPSIRPGMRPGMRPSMGTPRQRPPFGTPGSIRGPPPGRGDPFVGSPSRGPGQGQDPFTLARKGSTGQIRGKMPARPSFQNNKVAPAPTDY
jgi:hypothetical protein